MNRFKLALPIAVVVLLLGVLLYAWSVWPRQVGPINPGGPGGPGDSGDSGESDASNVDTAQAQRLLQLTRSAIASTENLQSDQAVATWNEVLQSRPNDLSAAHNAMLAATLVVDQLAADVTKASTDPDEVKRLRQRLPGAIQTARDAADRAEQLARQSDTARASNINVRRTAVVADWVRTRIDLHEAALLPPSMTASIRREVVERLADRLRRNPSSDTNAGTDGMIFGQMLIDTIEQLSDPIDGLPQSIAPVARDAIIGLSDHHRDNLYFALVAARTAIDNRMPIAADLVRRTSDLVTAIQPSIARNTRGIGKTPDELVKSIIDAIDQDNFDAASGSMSLWFNVLNGTQLVKTDRRRAGPHPLDLLSMSGLRSIATEAIGDRQLRRSTEELTFAPEVVSADRTIDVVAVDADLDGTVELAALHSAGDDPPLLRLYQFADDTWSTIGELTVAPETTGILAGDLFVVDSSSRIRRSGNVAAQHNTFENLIAYGPSGIQLIQIDGRGGDHDLLNRIDAGDAGLGDLRNVRDVILGDLEADGDLDLVVATADAVRMFVNRGNRTFFEIDHAVDFGDDPVTAMAIGDIDRDLDLDILTAHAGSGRVGLIDNQLHLQFRSKFLDGIPPVPGAASIAIEDVDGDVAWDVIVGGDDDVVLAMGQNSDAGVWRIATASASKLTGGDVAGSHLVTEDLDNDSFFEIIRGGDMVHAGPWGIQPAGSQTPPRVALATDFGGNGKMDLVSIGDNLTVHLNAGGGDDHYVDVRFKGIDDNVSGRVNHYAIGSVLEMRFGPHYRARIVRSPVTHFGLDGIDSADLRAILPNGLTQVTRDLSADALVQEEQKLKGSCPYLYAFNGDQIEFVTDCLWAAPLGLQVARDVVAADRPWEYLKVDGDAIAPRTGDDGRQYYDLRMTEELWEVAYFDRIELTAVDHPAGTEIWTNEKVGPPTIATPTVFAFEAKHRYPPSLATDTDGGDVTHKLTARDEDYVVGFDHRLRQGLCPTHRLDLTFDNVTMPTTDDGRIYLTLTGWILPTDTSLNIQIDQNPDLPSPIYPSLWTPDGEGDWTESIPFIGFPGGKTKTMVVDVTDHFDTDDPRLRIQTSAQIYWDAAQLVTQTVAPETIQQPCNLRSAEVRYRGFSNAVHTENGPDRYDYQTVSTKPMWPPLAGPMTATGDCTDLLTATDDAMVVIAGGDEIRLRFEVPPADPPAGWTRDFILHNVGWDKDADLNTLAGQSTLPLPHQSMTQYPPAIDNPDTSPFTRSRLSRHQNFRAFWSW